MSGKGLLVDKRKEWFDACPSMPSMATDDRKQFQCQNLVLKKKTGLSLLELKKKANGLSSSWMLI